MSGVGGEVRNGEVAMPRWDCIRGDATEGGRGPVGAGCSPRWRIQIVGKYAVVPFSRDTTGEDRRAREAELGKDFLEDERTWSVMMEGNGLVVVGDGQG